jgi:monovalent cation:H+ antiporter, CPA1 family
LILAIPGVVLTTLIVGGLVTLVTPLSLSIALLLGACISATDPVAVVSLFRRLGVPQRLSVLIKGESVFNDGTAIVIFELMLAVVLTGTSTSFKVSSTFCASLWEVCWSAWSWAG